MNINEWRVLNRIDRSLVNWDHYNSTRNIQRSLKYNSDPSAVVIHHLRDTEEQRKYNDEHYEFWGHNLDGTFEYGKYVIFVTKEEHREIHRCSEETRKKMSESIKSSYTDERKQYISYCLRKRYRDNPSSHPTMGKHHSDATKQKMSESHKRENMSDEYRKSISEVVKRSMTEARRKQISESKKNLSEEARLNLSNAAKKRWQSKEYRDNQAKSKFIWSDEKRKEFGESRKGENNPMYGKHPSDEAINKRRESLKAIWDDNKRLEWSVNVKKRLSEVSNAYKKYKADCGELTWNDFQKIYKSLSDDIKE